MTLFLRNNIPLQFHLIGIDDQQLIELTDLIVKNGGKVGVNNEFSFIKFTTPKMDSSLRDDENKLYDVQFLKDCIRESRIVDYRNYRLNKSFPSDDCVMNQFLFGQCCVERVRSESNNKSVTTEDKGVQGDVETESEATNSQTCSSVYDTAESKSRMTQTEIDVDVPCQAAGQVYLENSQRSTESQSVIPCNRVYPVQMVDSETTKIDEDPSKPGTSNTSKNNGTCKTNSQLHRERNEREKSNESNPNDEMMNDGESVDNDETEFESESTYCSINDDTVKRSKVRKNNKDCSPEFALESDSSERNQKFVSKEKRKRYIVSSRRSADVRQEPSTKNLPNQSRIPQDSEISSDSELDDAAASKTKRKRLIRRQNKDEDDKTKKSKSTKKGEETKVSETTSKLDSSDTDEFIAALEVISQRYTQQIQEKKNGPKTLKTTENINETQTISSSSLDNSDEVVFVSKAICQQNTNPRRIKSRGKSNNVTLRNREDDEDAASTDSGGREFETRNTKKKVKSPSKIKTEDRKLPVNKKAALDSQPSSSRSHRFVFFSNSERRQMIDYLISTERINEAKGLIVWRNMIEDGILTHRTPYSVQNHFMKHILPHVHELKLEKDILEQFLELKKKRSAVRKKN